MSRRPLPWPIALFALALSAPASGLAAPVDAPTQPQGRAAVLRPLTLLKIDDLDFGRLAVTSGGTATISPTTGALAVTAGLTALPGGSNPARFRGAGTRLMLVLIRVPNSVVIRRSDGPETLTVDQFTLDGPAIRVIGPTHFDFVVGARLTVPAGTVDGSYSGQMNVTVEYF